MPRNKKEVDEDDSDNDDSDDSENQFKVNTDNSPKVIPVAKLPDKLKYKKIVLNVSDTQYPIVTQVGQQLGWIIQDQQSVGDWDVWWTDRQIQPNTLYRMNLHQKINHFPGIYVLARKNLLGLHLMGMQKKFPSEYNFFPQTWMLPMQFPLFRQYYENVQEGKVRTYIVKPEALSQGRGIFLTRNIEDVINGHKYVVQRYLKNPLLLDGLKFDLRIYVLLAGSQPLRLYIYQQGLARLATRPYQAPTAQNLHQNYIHLTNYSLNKTNPEYIYNKSDKDMDVGHKRSLKGTYERLAKNGVDIQKLKLEIQQCIIKTVISGLPSIRHQYKYCQPQQYEGNMCFHILGFDVMIMDDLKPIVIQVNHTPSFQTGTPLDYMIKKNLIKDTLKLMRITSKNKKTLFMKSKELTKKRIETGKRDIFKGEERKECLEKWQKLRDQEQREILEDAEKHNGYKPIFPFKDPKKNQQYAKFYEGAQKVMRQLKDMRKKIISEENSSPSTKKETQSCKNMTSKSKTPSSSKDVSIERSMQKKTSIMSSGGSGEKSEDRSSSMRSSQQSNLREELAMSSSGNSSENEAKVKSGLDTIIEHHQHEHQHQQTHKDCHKSQVSCPTPQLLQTPPPQQATQKPPPSPSPKTNFKIHPNPKYLKKHSLNSPLTFQDPLLPQTKYQQLIDKFIKSKDLQESEVIDSSNRMSLEGLLQEKLTKGRNSRTSNHEEHVNLIKQQFTEEYAGEVCKSEKHNRHETISTAVKGYKQKFLMGNTQGTRPFEKEKFFDAHLAVNIQSNGKNTKGSNSPGYGNFNFVNGGMRALGVEFRLGVMETGGEVTEMMEYRGIEHKEANKGNDPRQSKPKDSKCTRSQINKLGKFLKPKTYNLHQSKFPQQQKFIVRVDPTTQFTLHPPPKPFQPPSFPLPPNHLLSFQQYNEHFTHNNNIIAQQPHQGYVARSSKVGHYHSNPQQRNLSTLINGKPLTSHKQKSSSIVYKKGETPGKDGATVLGKMVERVRVGNARRE